MAPVNNRNPERTRVPPPPPPPPRVAPAQEPAQRTQAPTPAGPADGFIAGAPSAATAVPSGQGGALDADAQARYDEIQQAGGPAADNARALMAQGKFADYAKVEKTIDVVGAPLELADLRRSLGSGKLNQPGMLDTLKSLTGGGTTAMGYNRNQVLCQLAQDLGRTDQLFQKGPQPDCGGMATEYLFAQSNPAEYAKAVRDLAETGKAKIGNLDLTADRGDTRDLRGPSQRLFASSFVKAAGGAENGLIADQMKDALGKATGRSWDAMYLAQPDKGQGTAEEAQQTQAAAAQLLREHGQAGEIAMVNRDGHWCAVTGVTGSGDNAKVSFVDENGGKLECTLSNFVKELDSVVFNPAVSNPAARGNPGWQDHGGQGDRTGGMIGADEVR